MTDLTYRCVSYPAFEPDHTWLRQLLLFADEIYRIVPNHYPAGDSDEMKRLIELTDGAVQTCDPQPYVEITPTQAHTFGKALDQSQFTKIAKMVRELKDLQRINQSMCPTAIRDRVDGIVEHVGSEMKRFRESKAASKFNEWVPFALTSLVPIATTLALGPLPGVTTGLFSFGINAITKATRKTAQFSYPKVLQTLCAIDDAAARVAVRKLSR